MIAYNIKKFSTLAITLIFLATLTFISLINKTNFQANAAYKDFFVDQSIGNDLNDGSQNNPFQTLEKARDTVSTLTSNASGDIIVNIVGNYQISSTFNLGINDSGKNSHKIIYQSTPTLSGTLHGAKEFNPVWLDTGNNIWKTTLNGIIEAPRSAYLNDLEILRSTSVGDNFSFSRGVGDANVNQDSGTPVSTFKNQSVIEFAGTNKNYWKHTIHQIDSIDGNSYYLKCPSSCTDSNLRFTGLDKLYVSNALELVTEENEWYFDKSSNEFFIKKSNNPTSQKLSIPQTEQLVTINGASNIVFNGLNIKYGAYNYLPNRIGIQTSGQGGVINVNLNSFNGQQTMKGTIQMDNSNNIEFLNNKFTNNSGFVLNCNTNCNNHNIENNEILNSGAGAIIYGNMAGGSGVAKDIKVYNNLISGTGTQYYGAASIYFIYAQGVFIDHNEITNTSYSPISIGWGWDYNNKNSSNNTITNNEIWNYMKQVYDGGAIYTLSSQTNSIVKNNYIHDTKNDYGALYPDEGSGDIIFEANVVDAGQTFWTYIWGTKHYNLVYKNNWVKSATCNTNFGSYSEGPNSGQLCEIIRGTNTSYSNNQAVNGEWSSEAQAVINFAGRISSLPVTTSSLTTSSNPSTTSTTSNSSNDCII